MGLGIIAGCMEIPVIIGIWIRYGIILPDKRMKAQWAAVVAMGILTVLFNLLLFCQNDRILTLLNIGTVYLILTMLAGIDLKKRQIPNRLLAAGCIIRVMLLAYEWRAYPETIRGSVFNSAAGFAFGFLFLLLLSFLTRHGIGYGDVKMFAWIGFSVGLSDAYNILFYSVLAAAAAGVWLLAVKNAGRKQEMPFAPFVYIGSYLVFCMAFLRE